MCCLVYEYAAYQEIRKSLPRVGKRIQIPEGEGKIIRYNLIRSTVALEMEDKRELELPLADLVELLAPEPAPEPAPQAVRGRPAMDEVDKALEALKVHIKKEIVDNYFADRVYLEEDTEILHQEAQAYRQDNDLGGRPFP